MRLKQMWKRQGYAKALGHSTEGQFPLTWEGQSRFAETLR